MRFRRRKRCRDNGCRKPEVVETGTFAGRYDLPGRHALVDDPRHGRLYITEAYGGEGTLDGGAYRWRHGLAIKVPAGTTLEEARKLDLFDPRVPLPLESLCGERLVRYIEALGL